MTIDDAEHYSPEERAKIIASYPPHEREARTKGVPVLGSGRIFPVEEEAIKVAPFRIPGFQARDTSICDNTRGVASVMVVRPVANRVGTEAPWTRHHGDILFTFVLSGHMTLEGDGKDPFRLSPGDAFVIPPGMATRYVDATEDLELLEVALPGRFDTDLV